MTTASDTIGNYSGSSTRRLDRITFAVAASFFALSGATSLVYQVIWMRSLSLFFGSDVFAAAITLSVFMGGLSLGSWLLSKSADRVSRPMFWYGMCELGIGAAALLVPVILMSGQELYRETYQKFFATNPWFYHAFRVSVSAAVLLIPTVLMGATFPLLVRQFVDGNSTLGKKVSQLYAVNTLGALMGTLLTGFFLLPKFGVKWTNQVTMMSNCLIGLGGIVLSLLTSPVASCSQKRQKLAIENVAGTGRSILITMMFSGMAALALEIVWMRILVQSFSSTVYSFSVMLGCFLFGIFYGSKKGAEKVDNCKNPAAALAEVEINLAVWMCALTLLCLLVPSVFGRLLWGTISFSGVGFGAASLVAQAFVASLLIFVPTSLLGSTFPLAVKAFARDIESRGEGAGLVYATNTIGAVFGALLGGFVFLPMLGTKGSLVMIAVLFVVAAWITARKIEVQVFSISRNRTKLILGCAVAGGALLIPRQIIVNYALQSSTSPQVIYQAEGISHTVDIVKTQQGNVSMLVDGNIEADTTNLQRRHFVLKSHLPLLVHPGTPRKVAVIGLGLGITLTTLTHFPTVEKVQVIELSPEMVRAHGYLKNISEDVLNNPKVNVRLDDGRNFMQNTEEKFDLITADPIHPRITGVGYLYTKEYYEALKLRLLPQGIITQWMPMYNISRKSFDVAFRTFASVFPNSSFWYVRGHGLFVASQEPMVINFAKVEGYFKNARVSQDMNSIGISNSSEFLGHLLMDSKQIARYLASGQDTTINTDDNAYLEYHTPFEFLEGTQTLVPGLVEHSGWNIPMMVSAASGSQFAEIGQAFQKRVDTMPKELSYPIN